MEVNETAVNTRSRLFGEGTFARASSLFTATRVLGAFVGVIKGFLIAKWLGPTSYGTWQFVSLFGQYGAYAGLSTRSGINREIPFLRGRGDLKKLHAVASSAFVANFFGPLLYGIVVFGCSLLVTAPTDAKALALYSPVIVLLSWVGYSGALAMAVGRYNVRTKLGLLDDISTGLLAIAFVYIWGIYGVIVGFGLAAFVASLYSARKLWQYFSFKIDWRLLWNLILVGLPIMANGILLTTMATVDHILIAAMLSRDVLGVYGLARAGVAVLQTIPASIGQMLFVKFAEFDGQSRTNIFMSQVLNRSMLTLSVILAPIVSVAIACFPFLVVYLLPEYVNGIASGRLLIASVFFLGVSIPITNWCVSTRRYGPVLTARLAILAAEFLGIYTVIRSGAGLESVAVIALCAFAVFCIAMIFISNYLLENSFSVGLSNAGKSLVPFLIILITILMQNYIFWTADYVRGPRLISSTVIGLLVASVGGMLILYGTNRCTGLLDLIFNKRRIPLPLDSSGVSRSR
jgi:O-antigen/teichoic acid export membrane protein